MQDIVACPICGLCMKSYNLDNSFISQINKRAIYTRRLCLDNFSHVLSFWADQATNNIDLLKLSLFSAESNAFSTNIEIDFHNTLSIITYWNKQSQLLSLPIILPLDFPDLSVLKEKIKLYGALG